MFKITAEQARNNVDDQLSRVRIVENAQLVEIFEAIEKASKAGGDYYKVEQLSSYQKEVLRAEGFEVTTEQVDRNETAILIRW